MIQLSLHARDNARIEAHVSLNGTAWLLGEDDRDKAVLFLTPEAARQIVNALANYAGLIVSDPPLPPLSGRCQCHATPAYPVGEE